MNRHERLKACALIIAQAAGVVLAFFLLSRLI